MKSKILFLAVLIIAFSASSPLIYAPENQAPAAQAKFKTASNQFGSAVKIQDSQEQSLGIETEQSNVQLIGTWPYGICEASALDSVRKIALIGNGYALQVLDISTPSSIKKTAEVIYHYKERPRDISISGDYGYLLLHRSLRVLDIRDPYNPSEVGAVNIDDWGNALDISSNYAYVAEGRWLRIYDISNPANPTEIGTYAAGNWIWDVAVGGNYAFIIVWGYYYGTYWGNQMRVIDVSTPSSPTLKGTYDEEAGYGFNGIDASDDGYAYITQNRQTDYSTKLIIIDAATDPSHPVEVGSYFEEKQFTKVAVSGNYAYLHSPWDSLFRVIDISDPANPFLAGKCKGSSDSARNFFVSGNLVGASHGGFGFSFYNVLDPSHPSRSGSYDTPDNLAWAGNRAVVSGNYVYISNRSDGLRIMDVSTPSDPKEAGLCKDFYSDRGIAISGNYAFCAQDGLRVIDISSPSSPSQKAYLNISWQTSDIAVSGSYAYVSGTKWISSDSWACLGIIDISAPLNPSLVGYYLCSTKSIHRQGIVILGRYAYLGLQDRSAANLKACLKVIDISDPTKPTEVGSYVSSSDDGSELFGLAVRGKYAYFAGGEFRIIDISSPQSPVQVSFYPQWSNDVALSGNYAYLAWSDLVVFDVSDPYNPVDAGCYPGDFSGELAVTGNYIYVPGSLHILKNTSAPEVSITSPSAWSTVNGSVPIEVQASHSSGIAKVEFYIDDVLRATDTTSPYSYTWDTTPGTDGPHKVRAQAYNSDGKSSDSEIEVRVKNYWDLKIFSTSGGTTNPAPGTHLYLPGTDALVTAIPDSNYRFSYWTGDVPAGHEEDNPLTIFMDSDKTITANFIRQYTLSLTSGSGGTTDPSPGSHAYDSGMGVIVRAIPSTGYGFNGWTGNVPAGHEMDNPVTIVMDSDKTITANFIRQYILAITSGAGGTTDPSSGSHTYNSGTEVSIRAIPSTYYAFNIWSGDVPAGHEKDNPLTITIDADKSLTATFLRNIYAPLNFSSEKAVDSTLFLREYINVLSWQSNPNNVNIAKYRIYEVEGQTRSLLVEVNADVLKYWHMKVEGDKQYTYALCAVDNEGREGEPAYSTVSGIEGKRGDNQAATKVAAVRGEGLSESDSGLRDEQGKGAVAAGRATLIDSRKAHKPLGFSVKRVISHSFSEQEWIDILSWEANPGDKGIVGYRIYLVEGQSRMLLAEVKADIFEYWDKKVDKDKKCVYALCAVDDEGREGEFAYVKVK